MPVADGFFSKKGDEKLATDRLPSLRRRAKLDRLVKSLKDSGMDARRRNLIEDAYRFSEHHHQGQSRLDGSDYIDHPVDVAMTLFYGFEEYLATMDSKYSAHAGNPYENLQDGIASAILHDTVEDTEARLEDIFHSFNDSIGIHVYGMTKPKKNGNKEERDRRYHQTFETVLSIDRKLLLTKISDAYHNSCNLSVHRKEKSERIAWNMAEHYLEPALLLNNLIGMKFYHNLKQHIH